MAYEFNYTEGWDMLMAGLMPEAALYPYTHLLGPMFYGLLAFFTLGMVYMKTEDFGTTGVTGLLVAAGGILYLPVQVRFLAMVLAVISVTAILFRIFASKKAD